MQTQCILTPFFLDRPLSELEELVETGWIVNRPPLPDSNTLARLSVLHTAIAEHVAEAISAGLVPVSVAGDCCTAIGVMAGLQHAGVEPVLLWFDAHGDFNTWDTTPSAFLGGMPLAMLAGLGEQTLLQTVGLQPLPHERIILTDGRDLDPGEKELLAGSDVVFLRDPKNVLEYSFSERPVYVHFDTDIINPLDAPAMNYVAQGGPRAMALAKIFRYVAQSGRITAISLSTWNPKLDTDGRSKDVSLKLLRELLEPIERYQPYFE